MPKKATKVNPPLSPFPFNPVIPIFFLLGITVIILFSFRSRPIESGPSGSVQIEVHDPAALNQNGQPLTNEQSVQGSQSVNSPNPAIKSPQSSNLQGSGAIQETAPADKIPSDWLE